MAYTPEEIQDKFDLIIKDIEEHGLSLRKALEGFLSSSTFFEWLKEDEEKSKRYARACEVREEGLFDEMLDIADESNLDYKVSEQGNIVIDGQAVQRSKLRIETRQWMLGKMNPKKYGTQRTESETSVTLKGFNIKDVLNFDNT